MLESLDIFQSYAETIIALCALFVSVASILIGYYSLKSQQKHNRLSVKPIGKIHFITAKKSIEIEIRNDGTGPLVCPHVRIFREGRDGYTSDLREAIPMLRDSGYAVGVSAPGSTFSILPGDTKTLLTLSADEATPEFLKYYDGVLEEIRKITLEVDYQDIYGQLIETMRREKWKR